jgi:hypothetical protein
VCRLFERDQADLRAPLDMLWTAFADESREGVNAGETLVTGGGTAVSLLLEKDEKLTNKIGPKIDNGEPVDRLSEVAHCIGEKLCQHVAVASLGVDREVAIAHQVLEQETTDPRPEGGMISHR